MKARHGRHPRGRRTGDSGMALVVAMMTMALLSVLALAGIATSTLEVKIAGNDRESKQAFFLCEAGLEKARYGVVQGWGSGTWGGGPLNFTFAFDPATMPTTVQTWATDQWVHFTLVDEQGLLYRINAHDTANQITDCVGPALHPANGFARIFYNDDGIAEGYAGGTPQAGPSVVFSPSPNWTVDWTGYVLRDTDGNEFPITGNTTDTLMLSGGTPTGTTFFILRAVGGTDTFTLFENPVNPGDEPGAPNAEWAAHNWTFAGSWFLRDRNGTLFPITATSYQTLPDRMVLTVTGTPASGAFQLVTNPWLESLRAAGPQSTTFTAPAPPAGTGLTYGSVALSTVPIAVGGYRVTAASTGTTTGIQKQIFFDVALEGDSLPKLSNWRSQVQ